MYDSTKDQEAYTYGMHRWLAITRKGDNIRRRAICYHLLKRGIEHIAHILACVETSLARMLIIPAALAIDAVETTQFRIYRKKIYTQRQP